MTDRMYDICCPRCGEFGTLSVFRVHAHRIMNMGLTEGKLRVKLHENECNVELAVSDYMYPSGDECTFKTASDVSVIPASNIPYAAVHCESCSLYGNVDLWEVYNYNMARRFKTMVTLFNLEEEKLERFTIPEILEEINRDRSDDWIPYTSDDWREGWDEFCEGNVYKLLMVKSEAKRGER